MSGALTAVVVGAAVSAVSSIYTSNKQEKAQKSAQKQAQANADKQATAAEQAFNAANRKSPNTSEILDAATQAGRAGVSGTMLTGSSGVDKNSLALGRNTLLGQ